jgi:hypothetical protein
MARHWLSFNLKRVTVIAAAVVMSGTFLTHTRLDDTKLPTEILNRPFGIGLRQIEYCLLQEWPSDKIALFLPFPEDHFKCPIENQH